MANAQPVIQVDVNGVPVSSSGGASTNLVSVGGANIALGQTDSAHSLPVAIANDESLTITGTVTASGSFQDIPGTSGGLSITTAIVPNNTTGVLVSAGAHQVYSIAAFNNSSTIAYLKLYNKATAPTVGTDTPVWIGMIPGPAAGGGGFTLYIPTGLVFSLGIGYGVTTGIANADTTAPAASAYLVNIGWK